MLVDMEKEGLGGLQVVSRASCWREFCDSKFKVDSHDR